ncbi:Uncharacterised protein [Mycobacteroides abscessus]|nr:Uncharacterised protein [Mycobacteroides abscessus]
MYIGDHILPVDHQLCLARQAQGGVQHRTVLGGVDMRPGEHGVAAPLQIGRLGQIDQQRQGFAIQPVLAVIDIQITDGDGQLASPGRILGEELSQVSGGDLLVMSFQCLPRR